MSNHWITGARGFIGRHLSRHLSRQDKSVQGLGHGAWVEAEHRSWGVTDWINGDISMANLDALAARAGLPDVVYHLAGGSAVGPSFATPAEDFKRSVLALGELLEWLRTRSPATAIVMASSAAVYGAGHTSPIAETAVCSPYSPYGFHKRMAELLLESYGRNFGLHVAIVRLFSVYGPGLRKQLLWDACTRLSQGGSKLELGGSGNELRDWLHVEDAARIIVQAASKAEPNCFLLNGGTGVATPVREIAMQLCASWGADAKPQFSGIGRAGDPQCLVANADKLLSHDIRVSHAWRAGLDEFVAWYKSSATQHHMEAVHLG
jgi:UDP-glucose 4-epimerase